MSTLSPADIDIDIGRIEVIIHIEKILKDQKPAPLPVCLDA
jgi:hypothetical protein